MWNVLIVDDDFSTRKLMNRMLQRKATVDHAANGREALFAYELSVTHQEPYDVILLDVTMPDLNGDVVLEEIRRREKPQGSRVPIIMVTGRQDCMTTCFEKGCDAYLVKPVSPSNLLQNIRQLVEG